MFSLQEKLRIIENSNSLLDLNSDVLPKVHRENYYFVSYSHKDYKKVIRDILLLQEEGINIWYDSDMHIGENWEDIAEMYISKFQCKGIIFYLSENSILSKACNKEVKYVLENNKQFFSINMPLDNYNNINNNTYMSGLEMALELKKMGRDISDELISSFAKAFSSNLLYLSYYDSIERKKEQIEKLVGEDLFSIRYSYSTHTSIDTSILKSCRDNSLVRLELKKNYQVNDVKDSKHFGLFLPLEGIDKCAFTNLFKLNTVHLPETVTEIDDYAFANCFKLKKINLDNDLIYIQNYVFANCTSLDINKIYCRYIYENAFRGCVSLKELELKCYQIGKYTFYECLNLEKITIPLDILSIDYHAFDKCKKLKEIYFNSEIPNNVSRSNSQSKLTLSSNVFEECAFEHFTLKGNIDISGATGLFMSNYDLKEVIIDIKSKKQIPDYMFEFCYSLEKVNGISNFKKIGSSAFYRCTNLKEIDLSKVKVIEDKAFCETNITELILDNVETIGHAAFALNDSLTKVRLGENIKSLDGQIFYSCMNLKELEILGKDFEFEYSTFDNICPEVITLCDLTLLEELVDIMYNLKTLYVLEGLIQLDELKDITSLEFVTENSDKDGFDKFVINNINPFTKYLNKRVFVSLKGDERVSAYVERVGYDEERQEYYLEMFDRYYESDIISIEYDWY